jgi:hypothetical protein
MAICHKQIAIVFLFFEKCRLFAVLFYFVKSIFISCMEQDNVCCEVNEIVTHSGQLVEIGRRTGSACKLAVTSGTVGNALTSFGDFCISKITGSAYALREIGRAEEEHIYTGQSGDFL